MPPRKSRANKSSTPQQTTFIEPQPQVKNGDILDVDEAAILLHIAPFGRTLKYQGLYQGPDRCAVASYVPRLITCASS